MQQKNIVLLGALSIIQKNPKYQTNFKGRRRQACDCFVALRKIDKDEEIFCDYSDNSTDAKTNLSWLKN